MLFINILVVALLGLLTLDSFANGNSRFAAFLLSLLLPYLIVRHTMTLSGRERLLQYGTGSFFYLLLLLPIRIEGWQTGLIPCLAIYLLALYFGRDWIQKWGWSRDESW